jgi:hypothetical protein
MHNQHPGFKKNENTFFEATPLEKRGIHVAHSPLFKRGDPDKIFQILSGSGC